MTDVLTETFRCEKYVSMFPTGMPLRSCLRRQLERVALAKQQPRDWPAAKPFCAGECPLGRANLERARAAGVEARTCPLCGSALVGAHSCETCLARRIEAGKEVPRGVLPPPVAQMSERIWSGQVPDVPFVPPASAHGAETTAARPTAEERRQTFERHEREAAARRAAQEQHNPEGPAAPAMETEMAKTVCGNCKSPSRHRGTCKGGPRVPADSGEVTKSKAGRGKPEPSMADVIERATQGAPSVVVAGWTVEQLLSFVAEARKELKRRRDEARALAARLESAIDDMGEAA